MIGRIGTLVHQVLSVVVCSPKVASSGISPTPNASEAGPLGSSRCRECDPTRGISLPSHYYGSIILLRIAYRTRSAEEESSSFRMTAALCVSTVLRLMLSILATCLLV